MIKVKDLPDQIGTKGPRAVSGLQGDGMIARHAWRCVGRTYGETANPCDFQTLSSDEATEHYETMDHDMERVELSADCDAPCFEDDPCPRHVGRTV